jgi:alkylhydroperoxidase family enzyme
VPIIEPIPLESLPPRSKEIIETGMAQGLYATPLPLQVFAYRSQILEATHEKRTARGGGTVLGGRILELLRIRSAQLGECQPCMQSRKHDSITDDDVACLVGDDRSDLNPQERMALRFLDLLSADHHAIDADFYGQLGEVFGTEPPVLPYSADQVDTRRKADEPAGASN